MSNEHIKTFSNYLNNLLAFVSKIETHKNGDETILQARLADDMFPLFVQAQIGANFSLRTCCPIAGVDIPSFASKDKTYAGLKSQLKNTVGFLTELDTTIYDLSVGEITDQAGPATVCLPTTDFLNLFALPNFFFHISMVYAIARANGVPATKGDYDGFHQYPAGFSFER